MEANNFEKNLAQGQMAEVYVAKKMLDAGNIFLWPLTKDENRYYHADLCPSVRHGGGVITAIVDVKADTYIARTGNVVFELWSNTLSEPWNAGWGQSNTTYVAVVDASKKNFGGIWLFRMRDLQAYFVIHRKELCEQPKEKYDAEGKELVQRTISSYIPLARCAEEYGYWHYNDAEFPNGGTWHGEGARWEFMSLEDCRYISKPPRLHMIDDAACMSDTCDWWESAYELQQYDYHHNDFTDPETGEYYPGFPWHCLIDGYPECGFVYHKNLDKAARKDNTDD